MSERFRSIETNAWNELRIRFEVPVVGKVEITVHPWARSCDSLRVRDHEFYAPRDAYVPVIRRLIEERDEGVLGVWAEFFDLLSKLRSYSSVAMYLARAARCPNLRAILPALRKAVSRSRKIRRSGEEGARIWSETLKNRVTVRGRTVFVHVIKGFGELQRDVVVAIRRRRDGGFRVLLSKWSFRPYETLAAAARGRGTLWSDERDPENIMKASEVLRDAIGVMKEFGNEEVRKVAREFEHWFESIAALSR